MELDQLQQIRLREVYGDRDVDDSAAFIRDAAQPEDLAAAVIGKERRIAIVLSAVHDEFVVEETAGRSRTELLRLRRT